MKDTTKLGEKALQSHLNWLAGEVNNFFGKNFSSFELRFHFTNNTYDKFYAQKMKNVESIGNDVDAKYTPL